MNQQRPETAQEQNEVDSDLVKAGERLVGLPDEVFDAAEVALYSTIAPPLTEDAMTSVVDALESALNVTLASEALMFLLFITLDDKDVERFAPGLGERERAKLVGLQRKYRERARDLFRLQAQGPHDWSKLRYRPISVWMTPDEFQRRVRLEIHRIDRTVLSLETSPESLLRLMKLLAGSIRDLPDSHKEELEIEDIEEVISRLKEVSDSLEHEDEDASGSPE